MHEMFNEADRRQMESFGITEDQVLAQIAAFEKSSYFASLRKPCTLEDGIATIHPEETETYLQRHQEAALSGRFVKFVPASGAATRMFHSLLHVLNRNDFLKYEAVCKLAESGDIACGELVRFLEEIRSFAFFEDLADALTRNNFSLDVLIDQGELRPILEFLLCERGLNYASLPKGLLKFHRYPSERRTPLEEHLVEAAQYVQTASGTCRVHFTVSPEHKESFEGFFDGIRRRYEERYGVSFELTFSCQKPSTSTIAVDMENRPIRDDAGRLVFRPGGHGALLENLNELGGDLVYIKNIDNLTPDHSKGPTFLWKRILGGCLVQMQDKVHSLLREGAAGVSGSWVKKAELFSREELMLPLPADYGDWRLDARHGFLLRKLNRPIRVCGVVRNVGEPGGAPFWVEDQKAGFSIQIVEKAQVDFDSPDQREVWMSSTHFNPVDVVCAVRDYEGKPFDLRRYANPEAVFITTKSKDGEKLKALELPGLWNGSMADWITMVVEVPRMTFNPVKTILDLLRPEHMPEGR